jgi:hypothetical protein
MREKKKANFLGWRRREDGGVPKHPRQIFNRGHGGTLIIYINCVCRK